MAWYFGYGSLIWRPGFEFTDRVLASLPGYARRFWQGSPDHRGTIENPGRVVTLVPVMGVRCAGVAYYVQPESDPEVLAYLDHRESGGYTREIEQIELEDGQLVEAVVYVGRTDNPSFIGPDTVAVMAEHIWRSRGPSGHNVDYLSQLSQALGALNIVDEHVEALLEHVMRLGPVQP